MKIYFILLSLLLSSDLTHAKDFQTNAANVQNAPEWLKPPRLEKIIDRIQTKLEWSIRRIPVIFYSDPVAYDQAHGLGPWALAVTVTRGDQTVVHMGPTVDTKNFDEVFGHELVHVIARQKYKTSIPAWLEEGLANHLAKATAVDYRWLAKQTPIKDVRDLAHPFKAASTSAVIYRYKASQAFAEMLSRKCDLQNLIRLSVERKMEDYMQTYCEIKDLNQAFADWVKSKAK